MAVRQLNELVSRFEVMKARRSNHEWVWQQISDLTMPWRGDVTTKRSEGQRRVTSVFDSTPILMAEQFASFLKGVVVPSGSDWVRLEIDDAEGDLQVRELLDRISYRVMRELHRSNFYPQAGTLLRDLSVLGNATMAVTRKPANRPGWHGLMFEAVPISRMWWHVGPSRTPEMVVREVEMFAIDAARFFGGRPGTYAQKLLLSGRSMDPVTYYHFVYENEDGVPGGLTPPNRKPWISQWLTIDPMAETVRTSGFENNPYVVGRWTVVDGEEYGRGRGHLARIDALGLNELRRQILIAVGRDMLPPLVVEAESNIEFDTGPDGIMVSNPPVKFSPYHLKTESNYTAADEIARQDRAQISGAFFGDALSEPETTPRSAEDARQRQARAIQRMAAPAEVVEKEFLSPMIANIIEIMDREGQVPELQELSQIVPGAQIDIELVSPFFTSQKSAALQRVRAFLADRIRLFADTQDKRWIQDIDVDGVAALQRKLGDLPAEIFLSEEEIDANREADAQVAALERIANLTAAQAGGTPSRAVTPASAPASTLGGELPQEPNLAG